MRSRKQQFEDLDLMADLERLTKHFTWWSSELENLPDTLAQEITAEVLPLIPSAFSGLAERRAAIEAVVSRHLSSKRRAGMRTMTDFAAAGQARAEKTALASDFITHVLHEEEWQLGEQSTKDLRQALRLLGRKEA